MVWRIMAAVGAAARVRHYRGCGVHSPFAYSLVREVFMRRRLEGGKENRLYDDLRAEGISRRRAVVLQNMHDFCNHAGHGFVSAPEGIAEDGLNIVLPGCGDGAVERVLAAGGGKRCTVCVLAPRESRGRMEVCERHARERTCLSIDKGGIVVFFFGQPLTKQHIKL